MTQRFQTLGGAVSLRVMLFEGGGQSLEHNYGGDKSIKLKNYLSHKFFTLLLKEKSIQNSVTIGIFQQEILKRNEFISKNLEKTLNKARSS